MSLKLGCIVLWNCLKRFVWNYLWAMYTKYRWKVHKFHVQACASSLKYVNAHVLESEKKPEAHLMSIFWTRNTCHSCPGRVTVWGSVFCYGKTHTHCGRTFCPTYSIAWLIFFLDLRREGSLSPVNSQKITLLLQSPAVKFITNPEFFTVLHANYVSAGEAETGWTCSLKTQNKLM